jgi:hypothetical protein
MTDENPERVQELNERIANWDAEHQHEMKLKIEAQENLKDTLALSLHIAAVSSIPSAVWIICWAVVTSVNHPTALQFAHSIGALIVFGVILAGAARGSGLLAHWWFHRSLIHERLAATVCSLLAAALLFGWVMVIAKW